jgi:hypothetical protein
LQKEYHIFNEKLGQTGAGLRFEDIEEGSSLSNLISQFTFYLLSLTLTFFFPEQLELDFPYWKHLHGFWRTLPNFNPYTASSEPGQDLATDTLVLIKGRGQNDKNVVSDDDEEDSSTKQLDEVCQNHYPPCQPW